MPTPSQKQDIEETQRIVMAMLKPYSAQVFLFGSAAKGTLTRHSDLDVAILPLEPLPIGLLAELRAALENSNIISKVDLVDLAGADDAFVAKVLREGKLWKD